MQKHRRDKEWTDDFAIMTNVRIFQNIFFLPVKLHGPIKSSFPKANESGSLADYIEIDTIKYYCLIDILTKRRSDAIMLSGDCNVDEASCPRYQHFSHGHKPPRLHSVNK